MPAKKTNFPGRKRALPRGVYFQAGKYLIRYKVGAQLRGEYFSTVKEAEEALAARKTDLQRANLGFIRHHDAQTIREFTDSVYLPQHLLTKMTQAEYDRCDKSRIEKLLAVFGDIPLNKITVADVEAYRTRELKKGRELEGVNRDLRPLKAIVNRAVYYKTISHNPIAAVKCAAKTDEERRPRVVSEVEEARLFEILNTGNPSRQKLRPLVELDLNTGLRRGELFGIEWRDILRGSAELFVRKEVSKVSRDRYIPLNLKARTALKEIAGGKPIVSTDKVTSEYGGLDGIEDLLIRCLHDAGIHDDEVGWYTFRHTFASRLLKQGENLRTVQKLMGHRRITTTEIYLHVLNTDLASAVGRL